MLVVKNDNKVIEPGGVFALGNFDGVHKGHRVVINRINDIAHKNGLQSLVFTLNPHPRHVLYPEDQQLKLIKRKNDSGNY